MFSRKELRLIERLVRKHYSEGRTAISIAICEKLNWRQPNGWLKDRACRDVLRTLERQKLVKLPKSKSKHKAKQKLISPEVCIPTLQELRPITKYPQEIQLELAKGNNAETKWNKLVNQYHYLGHKVVVGRCLKYLVYADNELVGAICFSSASWSLSSRALFLDGIVDLNKVHDCVINNSRFLILPNIQIPNLASTVLSIATKRVVEDWREYYSLEPLIVETFVEPSRFYGTCYKAANWLEIGTTKGYAKKGNTYNYKQEPKQIFVYGLNKLIRKKIRVRAQNLNLLNEQPYKNQTPTS